MVWLQYDPRIDVPLWNVEGAYEFAKAQLRAEESPGGQEPGAFC